MCHSLEYAIVSAVLWQFFFSLFNQIENENIFHILFFFFFQSYKKRKPKFALHWYWRLTNTFIIPNGLKHFGVKEKNAQNKTQRRIDELYTKCLQTILGCVSRWFYVVHWDDSSQSVCFYSKSPHNCTQTALLPNVNLGGCSSRFFFISSSCFCCTWTYVSKGCCKEYSVFHGAKETTAT